MKITKRQFAVGCVFVALLAAAYLMGASRINHSILIKRPSEDIDVLLVPVPIDPRIPTNHWIRYYDVYASRIPWRNIDSNYLPLHFIPHEGAFHTTIRREDRLNFVGVFGDTVKPFCPKQADIDSGRPFVIYLDYISSDLTGGEIDHVEIQPQD